MAKRQPRTTLEVHPDDRDWLQKLAARLCTLGKIARPSMKEALAYVRRNYVEKRGAGKRRAN